MPWFQLTLTVTPGEAHAISELCDLLGAISVTFTDHGEEPLFCETLGEQPLWQETDVVALFEDTQDMLPVLDFFKKNTHVQGSALETLEDQDWVTKSRESFKPMQFSQDFWVCPSWHTPPTDARCVRLDPGLAFGTGSHVTTSLCLRYLTECDFLKNSTVIDYGCGSGILGLSALALGAKEVWGVDIDPQAVTASQNNQALNPDTASRFHVGLPHELPSLQVDLVIANILMTPLILLAPTLAALNKPGSRLILSGILSDQLPQIREVYEQFYHFQSVREELGWILCSLNKK